MKCIVMFSGGLDSTIATHMMQQQGLEVLALNFALPFYSGLGLEHEGIKARAEMLKVELRIEEEGQEYLDMFRNRQFGFGKNANPCIDCRIHRLSKAAIIMKEVGASFLVTGEVVGQRPMSQRRACLTLIENTASLKGLILRPLSALIMEPTIPEEKGWVKREDFLAIGGRGRKRQMEYAKNHELTYPNPAGGCILTNPRSAERYSDMERNNPGFSLNDFRLLAYGRHVRVSTSLRLVMARYDDENDIIEKLALPTDRFLCMKDILGPYGFIRGEGSEEEIRKLVSVFVRYTRARNDANVRVDVLCKGEKSVIEVVPATEEECERLLV